MKCVDATFVINLDKARDRMKPIASQCAKLGIPLERVPGVDGSKLQPHDRRKVASPLCSLTCTNSMLGAALSHISIWKTVLKRGLNRALIMEDDVRLVPDFVERIEQALRDVPADFDVLLLGCVSFCDKDRNYSLGHNILKPFVSLLGIHLRDDKRTWGSVFVPEWFAGAHCYVVSAKGCRTLLRVTPRVEHHIDAHHMSHPDVKLYAASPDLAYQMNLSTSSIATYQFPKTLVPFLDTVKDRKNISLSYHLDAPAGELMGMRLNAYTVFFMALGLLQRRSLAFVAGLFVAELVVGGHIAMPLLAYLVGWALMSGVRRGILRQR